MKIFGKTLDTRILETIRAKAGKAVSRSALARRVCEILGWRRANQKPQDMTGRLILRELEKRGEIVLPASRGPVPGWKPPETGDPLWETVAGSFEGSLSGLGLLEIVPVTTKETSRVWNALFSKYYYLGKGPLCGAQIRYLARSSVLGYVGGAAFSSPAWKVAVRDLWIGWSSETREKNLGKVVNNSRFLILPHLRVSHLASHLLGRLLRRLPGDWERAFGERPVLVETFVERERFSGTCYRAANFVEIGSTAGLGRKGRGTSVKTVLAYPFVCDFRERLRELSLPETVVDRLIQQGLLQILQPLIDPTFSEFSYGFRPGRSAHDAVKQAKRYVEEGYQIVVDVDLERFFDRVNHDILMDRLAKRIGDKRILTLVRRYLQASIMADGVVLDRLEGTPQGSPLTPRTQSITSNSTARSAWTGKKTFLTRGAKGNLFMTNEPIDRPGKSQTAQCRPCSSHQGGGNGQGRRHSRQPLRRFAQTGVPVPGGGPGAGPSRAGGGGVGSHDDQGSGKRGAASSGRVPHPRSRDRGDRGPGREGLGCERTGSWLRGAESPSASTMSTFSTDCCLKSWNRAMAFLFPNMPVPLSRGRD